MPHELAGALQQPRWIGQRCPLKESDIYVRAKYIHIRKRGIAETRNGTAVVHDLADLVSAIPHHLKPLARDGSQIASALIEPGIDGWIACEHIVEPK